MSEPTRPDEISENEKYIRVCIPPGGKGITIEAFNYNGEGCRAATERLENRLGRVTGRKDKDDGSSEASQGVSVR